MSNGRRGTRVFAVFIVAVTIVFFLQAFGFVARSRVAPFESLAKLAAQLLGSVYAARCAKHHGKGNAAGRGWALMSAWLGCWCVGQVVLTSYENLLNVTPPLPSVGDAFFFAGYAFIIWGLLTFVRAYRSSGFAVGSTRGHVLGALIAAALFAVLAWFALLPMATAPTPFGDRLISVGYPLLDLVALIPAVVLLQITVGFRGGKVWQVWATLLVGIVFAMAGDIVFSDLTLAHVDAIVPLTDVLFILGYSFCGYGMRLQYRLVAE